MKDFFINDRNNNPRRPQDRQGCVIILLTDQDILICMKGLPAAIPAV